MSHVRNCRLVLLKCKGTPPCFSATQEQGDSFFDFLFASLDKVALQNWNLFLKKRVPFDKINLDRIRAVRT